MGFKKHETEEGLSFYHLHATNAMEEGRGGAKVLGVGNDEGAALEVAMGPLQQFAGK